MLTSKPRSYEGCWTCRLRRKKCDEERPVCAACLTLEIDCLYSDAKPEWMDGADLQREKAEEVKALVKRKATWRRERRYMHTLESNLQELEMTDGPDGTHVTTAPPRKAATVASSIPLYELSPPSRQSSGPDETAPPPSFNAADSSPHVRPDGTETAASLDDRSDFGSGYGVNGHSSTPTLSPPPTLSPMATATTQGTSPESLGPAWNDPVEATQHQSISDLNSEQDLTMAMVYFDYVFPFLFPFYRPPMLNGGRGWLLVLLMSNKALFHAALSLASYFFTALPADDARESCRLLSRDQLQRQQDLTVRELMADIADINARGVRGRMREGTRVLASIIQVLCFEIAVGNAAGSWGLHLDGAVVLLDQILQSNAQVVPGGVVCWESIMAGLEDGAAELREHQAKYEDSAFLSTHEKQTRPLNPHQAALSFFAAVLLQFDIVSSTALEVPPRLRTYHLALLATKTEAITAYPQSAHLAAQFSEAEMSTPFIDLAPITGISNWALMAVGDVAALDAWKKEQRALGKLSIPELVYRAAPIEAGLRQRIADLDAQLLASQEPTGAATGSDGGTQARQRQQQQGESLPLYTAPPVRSSGICLGRGRPAVGSGAWITRIWAQAALSYLLVVVSGWQPASPAIRESVAATLDLLATRLATPDCLRAVGWPFAVTGCLAAREQEESLRGLVRAIGGLEVFGSVKEAYAAMEEVWARRAEIERGDGGEWDIARCFGLGGRRAFIV